jgi:hypothetical protein
MLSHLHVRLVDLTAATGRSVGSTSRRPTELGQQAFGLLQIGGVEAFGEPAVDRGQQLAGGGLLALLLPQAT